MAQPLDFKRFLRWVLASREFSSDRRRFVKTSVLGSAAALTLSRCTTIDHWVLGDRRHLDQEILILGGGLAGLSAAYYLKKNKVPYRLYEASTRLGGRVQTLFEFNPDHQFAEAGAEFFEGHHKYVLQLCKDMDLSIQDISYESKKERALYWLDNKVVDEKEFRRRLKPLASTLADLHQSYFADLPTEPTMAAILLHPQTSELDGRSLADLLIQSRGRVEDVVLQAFESLCVSEWGVEAKDINLLHFLLRMDFEEKALASNPGKIYRVEGGNSRVVEVLGERVKGIIPELTLKLEHRLTSLRPRAGGYDCTFETPQGSDTIWAKQVICGLPWSILKDVDGIQSLDIGNYKKEFLRQCKYATHAKVLTSFKDTPWRKPVKGLPAHQSIFRGQLLGQNYWDSSRGQIGTRGVISSQRGGVRGAQAGADSAAETLQDLRHFFKDLPAEESSQVVNWSQKPFAKGSRMNVAPGQYVTFLSALIEEDTSSFYMAGEHFSFRDGASMNGAVETGLRAAEKAVEKAFLKSAT